jgi:Alpha/beta hydrolase domain
MHGLSLPLIAVWMSALCVPLAAAQLVPTPRATVLPVSATNRPFLGAANSLQPVDLAAYGYVEDELLVSGRANLHEYATRMLVRRPLDKSRFSGRVVVELLNAVGTHDVAPLWGLSSTHFLRKGDVWVGLTINPLAAASLQSFDPVRYAALSLAYPQAPDCKPAGGETGTNGSEAGTDLASDVIAQVGALLRSSSKENPLLPYNPQRVVAAGYSQAGGYLVTFINALHRDLRLGDGSPIFDAYLAAANPVTPARVNQCAAPLAADDPRRSALPRDVPVVTVMTQSDFNRAPQHPLASDEPGDVYRLYEIAGSAQSGPFAAGQPSVTDLQVAGIAAPEMNLCKEPRSDFPLGLAFDAIWAQLDDQMVRKISMVTMPGIETDSGNNLVVDELGNARGGWRLPQLDIPLARYAGKSTPVSAESLASCALIGSMQRLDVAQLKAKYGNRAGYIKRFNAAVDQAVKDRRLTSEDAAALKSPVVRTLPTF